MKDVEENFCLRKSYQVVSDKMKFIRHLVSGRDFQKICQHDF